MGKLTIIYDPVNGEAVADGLVEEYAKNSYDCALSLETGITDTISTELLITAIRVGIKEGKFDKDKIDFVYKDGNINQIIRADKDGRMEDFYNTHDISCGLLRRLL